jgi:uncharacterized RDD family membrane protein YckC
MRDARPEGSPYPKADLLRRGLARAVDLLLAAILANAAQVIGPLLAAAYLLTADALVGGQSLGKRLLGLKVMVIPQRVPPSYRESILRNAPFAIVAFFYAFPILWLLVFVAGIPILLFESYMVWSDRLGIRIGDVFADTQVVDAKELVQIEDVARSDSAVAPLPTADEPVPHVVPLFPRRAERVESSEPFRFAV